MPTWVTLRPLYPDFARACSPRPQPPKPQVPQRQCPPAPGRELKTGCTRQLTYQGRGGSHYNGVNGEGRASTYTNGVLLTITLEAARAALSDREASGPPKAAAGAQFSPTRRERLVSPDLYLLDSPAGAIHRRGKAELHLVASG